jgi:hypothetical protein
MLLTILANNVMIPSVGPTPATNKGRSINRNVGGGGGIIQDESFYDKEKEKRLKRQIEDSEITSIVELTLKHFII